MTAAPTLTQVDGLPLYELSSYTEAGLGDSFWAGYRPGATSFDPSRGLDAAWEDPGGVYLLLGALPGDAAAFAGFSQALEAVLRGLPADVRILWIANPLADPGNWQLRLVQARASGSGAGISWQLGRSASLEVGQYALILPGATPLTKAASGYGIAVGGAGLGFEGPRWQYGAAAGSSWLALAGKEVGSWLAELELPLSAGDGMAGLGVALRYGAPRSDGNPGDAVDVLGMAVLGQDASAGDLQLGLAFDPLNPLADLARPAARGRTRLDFRGLGAGATSLACALRTSRGYRTRLTPAAPAAPLGSARLLLCRTPLSVAGEGEPTPWSYHLAPDGAFALTVQPPSQGGGAGVPSTAAGARLMLGLSGLEYAAIEQSRSAIVLFAAGRPAFAPAAAPAAAPTSPGGARPLSGAGTTAYLAVLPSEPGTAGFTYYAQPRQAPLYAAGGNLGAGFLGFREIAAKTLPGWSAGGQPPPTYPAAAMAGTAAADSPLARRVEQAGLAPERRRRIGIPSADATQVAGSTRAVTPQGLMVDVSASGLERVVIANLPATPERQLDLAPVGDQLRAALQANELFFVVGDPQRFMADSSIRFRLDSAGLALAEAAGVENPAVIQWLRQRVPFEQPNRKAFEAALPTAASAKEVEILVRFAGYLKAVIGGWTFQLSPPAWRSGEAPTLMLFKFCSRPLAALAEDGAAWGWQEAAGPRAQGELLRLLGDARERWEDHDVPRDDPYVAFYRDVALDPLWNGVLFLNAPVAIAELPSELQFLAAGVDPSRFYAHHVGFSATPVELEAGTIAIRQTAAFGLIDYRDPVDLTLSAANPNPSFGFKTQVLTARFANAALVDFSARVELMVNELLAAPLTKLDPSHGNNLVLTGSAQRQGGNLSYAFALEGEHLYRTDRTALESVQVDAVAVATTAGLDAAGKVAASFELGGWLRFVDLSGFDAFGYGRAPGQPPFDGKLRFDGLRVEMTFPLATPSEQEFAAMTDAIRLDLALSEARPNALVNKFPLSLTQLLGSTTQRPEETGFSSIAAPLEQSNLNGDWFGLAYELDVGTLGALAGATGLSLQLLLAWGPGAAPGARPIWLGLQLPVGMHWTLQSVIDLGFRNFQFESFEHGGELSYVLRLRRFALTLLGVSLPPGNLDLVLFGDPSDPGNQVVGWYAAYEQPETGQLTAGSGVER